MGPSSAPSGTVVAGEAAGAGGRFSYEAFDVEPASGTLRLSYRLGETPFVETVHLPAGCRWDDAAWQAARLVFLLAGVSYYKTAAPAVVDLGSTPLLAGERSFLRRFYLEGLGEFALRNGLDLRGLDVVGGAAALPAAPSEPAPGRGTLIPFGGGIDSIVTVEVLRDRVADPALFVVSPAGDRFAAIEAAAAATGLPVVRAERALDEKVLAPARHGFLTGHVPVTAVVSAIAVLAAILTERDTVVMSNERSASDGNVVTAHGTVNHQWSKSLDFEESFRAVLAAATGRRVDWFSLLRPCSELWVAERFARVRRYHPVFRSCNRSFQLDPGKRLDSWCGECDKCCFIDLVLAPFLPAADLATVFGGREPLDNAALLSRFEALLALSPDAKPWECVGDVGECRTAAVVAAQRPDRAGNHLLAALLGRLGEDAAAARAAFSGLLAPAGAHHVPPRLVPGVLGDASVPADPLV